MLTDWIARRDHADPERFRRAVDPLRCTRCGACVRACPEGAIRLRFEAITVDPARCRDCGRCAERCKRGALLRLRAAG